MATSMLRFWPDITLEVIRDHETIDVGRVPDPDWRMVDAAGHGHFYDDGYPTLEWEGLPCTMGHGDDCDAEGFYRCPMCWEEIQPAWKDGGREVVHTRTSGYVTIQDYGSRERWALTSSEAIDTLSQAVHAAVRAVLADHGVLIEAQMHE